MRVSTLALAGFAVLVLAPPTGARPAFDGKVCGLVPAKQIATVPGISLNCTNARPSKGIGSTNYIGNWAGKTASSPSLQITIALYTDSGALQLAKRNLAQGLPGTPKKVAGIGSGAYEAVGASSAGIHFSVGKYIAYVILNTRGASPRSTRTLEALARAVASGL
jgi:hypothetical protein